MDFKQKLKTIYKKHNKIAPLIEGLEGEIPQQTLDDYYVKLKTIIKEDDDKKQGNYETISGQKQEVEIEHIFNQSSIRRLLILGGAGVGKSTLMQYVAYRWSKDSLWKDKFDYVYRVTLKTLLNSGWDRDYDKKEREDELKCLAHYNLVAQGIEGGCKLKDMPWLEKKKKVLLLLDGYDEVAHERNGLYKKLFEKIFEHENIILTSRPNAVDKQMAEKFGKKIENTGLDYEGIGKYLSQYFKKNQEKGEALREFLDQNSSIKEICHIPVNIAMMCFIWAEGDSNEALHEISNMSDLYKQVIDHLGFRYFAKSNAQQNQDELMSKWRGGEIYLDELQVLEHTAYKGMTGGGLQVPEDKRFETLIIKGMTKKGDKDGISIQSSINYLRDQLKKDMPTINKVYKYGLLKPEGAIIDITKNHNKKEPSETDLQEQSFSFIHLSFQEFLTALYLVQHLLKQNNTEEQERIANFIAQHRNEPRYLMTLKLMAGILSAYDDDHKEAEQGIKIFWDAVLCNPDGVLELGVQAKVTLLMHLFGQAKKGDTVDKRIPNSNIAVDLIDSIVLQDLATWGAQLKESDYLSPNIKEGLLQYLIKNNAQWMSDMSSKLQEKFTKQIKKANNVPLEAIVEITSSIINKFSQDDQNQIFLKVISLLKNHNETTWQLTKKALEAITIIHQKLKLNLNDNNKKELFDALLLTAYDSNLTELSLKGIQEILNITKNPSSIEKIKANIKEQQPPNMKAEVIIKTKVHLFKVIPHNIQFLKDFILNSLVPFLKDPIRDVRILASNMITELAVSSTDKQLLLDVLNLLLPLLKDLEAKNSFSDNLKIVVNKGGHQKLIQDWINRLTPLLKQPDQTIVISTSSELAQLIKIKGDPIDAKLVSDIIKALIGIVAASDWDFRESSFNHIKEFVKITCQSNPPTAKVVVKNLTELFQDPRPDIRALTFESNREIFQVIDKNDIQFSKDIINIMVPIFKNPQILESFLFSGQIIDIVHRNPEISSYVVETLTPLLQNSNDEIRQAAFTMMMDTVSIDNRLARNVINLLIPLSTHSEKGVRHLVLPNLQLLLGAHLRDETQFITDVVIKTFIPRFKDSDKDVRLATLDSTVNLFPLLQGNDIHFLRDVTKAMIPLLKDSDDSIRDIVPSSFETIMKTCENWDTQLIRDIIKALTPILHDPNPFVRVQVATNITGLMNIDENSEDQFRKEVLNSLTPLLLDSDQGVKVSILWRIQEIIQVAPQLCRHAIDILTPPLQDSDPDIRRAALLPLLDIAQIDTTLIRDIFNLLSQVLQDSSLEVKDSASGYLVDLVGIANDINLQLYKEVFNLLSPFLQESADSDMKGLASRHLSVLARSNDDDIQFGRDIINLLTPLLQDKADWLRQTTSYNIVDLTKLFHNKDIEFVKSIIEVFIPLSKDPLPYTREAVGLVLIRDLVELLDKANTQLIQNAFDIALSFLQEPEIEVRRRVPEKITEFVEKIDIQLSRKAIEAFIPLLKDSDDKIREEITLNIPRIILLNKDCGHNIMFIKGVISSMTPLLKDSSEYVRKATLVGIAEIVNFTGNAQLSRDAIKVVVPLFKDPHPEIAESIAKSMQKICADRDFQFIKDIIDNCLASFLKDSDRNVRQLVSSAITEIIEQRSELLNKEILDKTLIPLLKDFERDVRGSALKNITELLKVSTDVKLVKEVIENFVSLLQDSDDHISQSTSSNLIEILTLKDDAELIKDVITILTPFFQHSNSDVVKNALEVLQSVFDKLLLNPNIFGQYLTHSSKNLRDTVASFLLTCLEKYLNDFQGLDQLFQLPLSDLTVDLICNKLFEEGNQSESFQQSLQSYLEKLREEELRLFLVSDVNKIKTLRGPGIIELSFAIIGQEKVSKYGSDREKLVELAKEVLSIQLKFLNEEGLIWINQNCEKLLSLSAEAKTFYKKIYHKLLEDEKITSLEEQLLIKFINQGLTTSLTRDGEIIFEGKRYRLKGDNIDFALEKIAKTVIDQQQDTLALQYKQHEPIFKISSLKGGMRQAAADIKEIRSIVDSRHVLKIEFWLLTKLKSLKFNSEIFLLEQRSAFGDHVIYHLSQQKLIRFYPNEVPSLQEIFGSYIYGEAYQGEVFELTDKVGEKLLESQGVIKPAKIQIDGKLKSKQIYFQQELLKQGNEDRNSAVEEELAKKLDNNRAVLGAKLKSFNLKGIEINLIEDYYEGFISTFSSVYTSSQAIDSGKLSIDDGEDFFSPVNLFIQLTSLAPFGIGEILSGGLEAVRSHLKSAAIANEAKFVKDFAIDAVELSDLVSKIALAALSNKEKRREILEAKDDEESKNFINKVKNLVTEKIEKLKNLAEKYTKMKNLFEKEVETSAAFRLGESNANKILKEWIDLKQSQPDLKMKPEDKQKKFVKTINAGLGVGNKTTSLPASPQEVRSPAKTGCCEIF